MILLEKSIYHEELLCDTALQKSIPTISDKWHFPPIRKMNQNVEKNVSFGRHQLAIKSDPNFPKLVFLRKVYFGRVREKVIF